MDIYLRIKKKVYDIINQYSTNDPKSIADLLGIITLKSDLGSVEGFLQEYKHNYIIHLNTSIEEKTKQDRILAHELGHYFLHRHLNIFKLSTHSLAFESSLEHEADIFSCELLLNDQMLEEEFNYIQGKNLAELAAFFNVDYEVANLKLNLLLSSRRT
ncbi:ImmA/IrrE family metallo-endopeptidase [Enterococcus mundtii]|uniref:ImmA/IrrE family metallo-endopeptidase n=1 Tax=Enterococcus mundtii TaxID=53346 RepID=UPI0010BEDB7D|nr:ImmA/IrrE family metallo-endopeptidase [Enterococcus mundtii]QCJ57047.1 toxin-antitoxin system, toxin component [Enterococcus mundtii]